MDELRERVRRELDGLEPAPGGLERTMRLVRRRRRNGRLAAAAIGLVATVGLVWGLWSVASNHGSGRTPPAGSSGPSSSPSRDAILVKLYPLGDRSDRMPTAVAGAGGEEITACTQDFEWTLPNGSHVRGIAGGVGDGALPVCRPRPALRAVAGAPITVSGDSVTSLRAERTVAPLYRGVVTMAIEARWADGRATFMVSLDVVVTDGSPTQVALACPAADQIPFDAPGGPRITPGGAAYVRGNLNGVRAGDVVEQMTRASGDTEWDGTWQVVRDGSVVARVDFPALDGTGCRGSRVGGV